MDFKDWIMKFKDKDAPIGDLAYDISRDKGFPDSNERQRLLEYIEWKSRFDKAIVRTFKNAWRRYERERT